MVNSETMGKSEDYYSEGNTDLAKETPLTVKRLETRRRLTRNYSRLVIALVGLPARGKSFVARKIRQYLNWTGVHCEIFNVGRYRRQAYASLQKTTVSTPTDRDQVGACDADFFDKSNTAASVLRERVAQMAMQDMLRWLDEEDEDEDDSTDMSRNSNSSNATQRRDRIAIFDATNSTDKRRRWILEQCTHDRNSKPTGVVFVESICDDQELLDENYRYKIMSSPDFESMPVEEAMADLKKRVLNYENQYETIKDDSLSYIKVFNLSTKLLVNHIYGRMAKELVPALMAWNIGTRPIFLCRPGQTLSGIVTDREDYVRKNGSDSEDNTNHRGKRRGVRADGLGPTGLKFRKTLLTFCHSEVKKYMAKRASVHDMAYTGTSISGLAPLAAELSTNHPGDGAGLDPFPMKIMTSTMPRAAETVYWDDYEFNVNQHPSLNPLDKGDFAGMELDELQKMDPVFFERLEMDPFRTRFPGGECYEDLIRRLTSVVIDIEQQVIPVLVVSHVSVLQMLMAYFRATPVSDCMSIEVPMHTVIKFTPVRGGGWSESQHALDATATNGMPTIESASEISTLSASEDQVLSMSPIWGDRTPVVRKNSKSKIR